MCAWVDVVRGDVGNAHARRGLLGSFTNRSRTEDHCAFFTDITGGRNCRRVTNMFVRATRRRGRRTGHFFGFLRNNVIRVATTCPTNIVKAATRGLTTTTTKRGRR